MLVLTSCRGSLNADVRLKNMKTTIIATTVGIISLVAGYLLGGYNSSLHAVRGAAVAEIMWVSSVDRFLSAGKEDGAISLLRDCADANFALLVQLDEKPSSAMFNVLPWLYNDPSKELKAITLSRAKQYYLSKDNLLSDASRQYLAKVPDSDSFPQKH